MRGNKEPCVYIMANKYNNVLYTGVTNDLIRRVMEHKQDASHSFPGRYKLSKLVYFELTERIEDAIAREKQIKGGSRKKKSDLINSLNPEWKDLSEELFQG